MDLRAHAGVHPRVGAVDVAPIVYTRPDERGAAVAMALVLAEEIGRLGVPVHLYGLFGRKRAEVRKDPGPVRLRAAGARTRPPGARSSPRARR